MRIWLATERGLMRADAMTRPLRAVLAFRRLAQEVVYLREALLLVGLDSGRGRPLDPEQGDEADDRAEHSRRDEGDAERALAERDRGATADEKQQAYGHGQSGGADLALDGGQGHGSLLALRTGPGNGSGAGTLS